MRRHAQDCCGCKILRGMHRQENLCGNSYILRVLCPQGVMDGSEAPAAEKNSEPITDERHESYNALIPFRNRISWISCVKLRIHIPGKWMEIWIWFWTAD